MRRPIRFAAVLTASFIVGACVDVPSAPDAVTEVRERGSIVAGTCTTVQELNSLARQVFGPGTPDAQSVLGKIKNLDQSVRKGQLAQAANQAHNIVDFTLGKHQADQTPAPDAVVTAFVNKVYCYAGIDIGLNDPSNSHLIFPSDEPQVKYAIDLQSAIRFDANPVSEPTLIEFQQLPATYPPGGGPLDTKLDQYPGFVQITKSSETDAPLTKPAVVGICASGVIPQEVRARLRLGHGLETGTEITPAADAGFLSCENATEAQVTSAGARLLRGVAKALLPTKLHARVFQAARGGGVGGTVTEFSPFAPVDPVLRAGGGVGGTVTEFIRMPMLVDPFSANSVAPVESCADGITGVSQLEVSEACRPFVRIATRLGTVFAEVPISWQVSIGGGKIGEVDNGTCGAFATPSLLTATDLFGRAAICWRLGSSGANQVVATPGLGGDAIAGVSFSPASVTFDATAAINPGRPTVMVLVEGDGQTGTEGQQTAIAPKVRVTDEAGTPIAGIPVYWVTEEGRGSATPPTTLTDADGHATATWTLGLGANVLKASANDWVPLRVFFRATGTTP